MQCLELGLQDAHYGVVLFQTVRTAIEMLYHQREFRAHILAGENRFRILIQNCKDLAAV